MKLTSSRDVTRVLAFLAVMVFGQGAIAESGATKLPYKAVFSVTEDDQHTWNEVFGNFRNIQRELGPDNIRLELVVYDQAMGMLKDDSLVAEKVGNAIAEGVRSHPCKTPGPRTYTGSGAQQRTLTPPETGIIRAQT